MADYNEKFWIDAFEKCNALWMHDGDNAKPHALLASGKHSSGYFNATRVVQYPPLCRAAITALVHQLKFSEVEYVDAVFGSAMGAITIAHETASQLSYIFDSSVEFGYTEKDGDEKMKVGRFEVGPEDRILMVEDVMTTGGTTKKSITALEFYDAEILSCVAVLVNRSGMAELDGRKIISLVDRDLPIWTPDECPLCKAGSKAVKPKENWRDLTA